MLRFPFLLPYGSSCSPIPELRGIPLLCVPFRPPNPMNRICRGRDAAGKLEFHLGFSEDKRVSDVLDPSPLNPRWTVEPPKGLSSRLENANQFSRSHAWTPDSVVLTISHSDAPVTIIACGFSKKPIIDSTLAFVNGVNLV